MVFVKAYPYPTLLLSILPKSGWGRLRVWRGSNSFRSRIDEVQDNRKACRLDEHFIKHKMFDSTTTMETVRAQHRDFEKKTSSGIFEARGRVE
jgi:hypothetical protein